MKINVKVINPSGIKWIKLSYRSVNQDMDYQTMMMNPTSQNDVFEALIPKEKIDPTWDFMYFIQIMDNDGRGIIYPDLNNEAPYIITRLIR